MRKIFDLALTGDGNGPMGSKAIATWLNAHGHRTQTRGRWGTGTVNYMRTPRSRRRYLPGLPGAYGHYRRVMAFLTQHVLAPERIADLIPDCVERAARQNDDEVRKQQLQREVREAEAGLQRLYDAIASGAVDPREPALKANTDSLRLRRDEAAGELKRLDEMARAKLVAPSSAKISSFAEQLRSRLSDGDLGRLACVRS